MVPFIQQPSSEQLSLEEEMRANALKYSMNQQMPPFPFNTNFGLPSDPMTPDSSGIYDESYKSQQYLLSMVNFLSLKCISKNFFQNEFNSNPNYYSTCPASASTSTTSGPNASPTTTSSVEQEEVRSHSNGSSGYHSNVTEHDSFNTSSTAHSTGYHMGNGFDYSQAQGQGTQSQQSNLMFPNQGMHPSQHANFNWMMGPEFWPQQQAVLQPYNM